MNTKIVIIQGEKTNYDGAIDYSIIGEDLEVFPYLDHEEMLKNIDGAGIVIVKEYPLPREIIERFPSSVHLLCEAGTGYNNIDVKACEERGITVCNIPAYSTECVAQTTMMLLLNMASSMRKQMHMLSMHDHSNFTDHLMVPHVEVQGKTLGLVGYGNIGSSVAKLARAFNMNVLVYTRTKREDQDGIKFVDLDTVLKEADFLSLHCPLKEETFHIIDEEKLRKMKKTAYIINTARGPLIDEQALIKALNEGIIAGAALDVQEIEPPKDDNPLYEMTNVILTPHIGWKGYEARLRLVKILADNIQSYIKGQAVNVVSKY